MSLTDEQYQQLIIAQVGDDEAGTLATNVPILWAQYADESATLRFLLTKRGAIECMQARVRKQVSFRALDGASVQLSDLLSHLATLYDQVQNQITAAESSGVLPQIGELTTIAPITPELPPDANDARYRGQPYPPPPTRPGGTWP